MDKGSGRYGSSYGNRASVSAVDQAVQRQRSLLTAVTIEPVQLGTSATTIFTAPDDSDFLIKHLWVADVTAGAVNYTLYFVPSGGTAALANTAVFQQNLSGNTSEVIPTAVGHRIPPGASIQAIASAATSVNIGGWGYIQEGEPETVVSI